MEFHYELLCSPLGGGVKAVKLNGKLIYFAAITAFYDRKGNIWKKAKTLVNKYIKGVSSSARLVEATRLLTFIALNKEFDVNKVHIYKKPHINNCYMAYNASRSECHCFGVCEKDCRLPDVLDAMRKISLTLPADYCYASVFDVASNKLTIIDPPSDSNRYDDMDLIYQNESRYRERLYHDFNALREQKRFLEYGSEKYEVVDFPDIGLTIGLNVKFTQNNTEKQYLSTDNLIISNGIFIGQLNDIH